jgi:signal transduction histidine kinase/CheY-like chemotaxis protein
MNLSPYVSMFLVVLMMLGTSPLQAQATRADSLFAIYADTTHQSMERVEAFYQRFNPLLFDERDNPEALRWIPYLGEVQELAMQQGLEKYMGRFLILEVGANAMMMNNMEKGCELVPRALKAAWKAHDFSSLSFAMASLKSCQDQQLLQLDQETYELYQHIEAMLMQDTFHKEKLPLYLPLLMDAYKTSQLPRALDIAQNMIKAYEEDSSQHQIEYFEALAYAGSIMNLIGNFQESERYLLKGLALANNDKVYIGRVNTDLAILYASMQQISKAHASLDSGLQIMAGEATCRPCIMRAHRIRANILNQEGKYQEALESLKKASYFYEQEERGEALNLGEYYSAKSTAYLGLEQYTKAISIAEKGIEKMNGNLYSCLQNYWVVYKAQEALGNHEEALASYQQYVSARDAMTELRNSQEVTKKELAFQYEQQKLANELLYQQQLSRERNNRNILMALGIFAALIAIGFYFRFRWAQKTKAALELKNQEIEAEKEKAKASELAKQQFLANMSHEIRTPMNAIKGMTDILLRRKYLSEQQDYLSAIKESSNSLLVIINDILDLSKIDAGKIDFEEIPFSLTDVISNVMQIMKFKAEEKGLQLKADIDELVEQQVIGDPTRLHQVLFNLVGNAIKFTEKGVVTIRLKREMDSSGLQAQFCVSDTGVGIGEDRLTKIFESFEQAYTDTSRKFGGTGLGLSISKKLVELQGGRIWAESQKGKGSQFYVSIPYAFANEEIVTIAEAEDKHAILTQLKGIKVLLVEDNKFNAIVAQEELEDSIEDAEVTVAENGLIAVEQLKSDDFDVVLMDVQMPVMNGYEATQAIRQLEHGKAAIPIIAMTANVMKEEVDRCFEAGMDDFIGKPFDAEELFGKMLKLTLPITP